MEDERRLAQQLLSSRNTTMGERDTVVPSTFPMTLAPGIHWVGSCLRAKREAGETHTGVWAYVIVGTEKAALFDTGLPQSWSAVLPQIEQVLDGRTLDYIIPSHPEYPHSGNLQQLLERYPGSIAVGDMRDYPLHYPEVADRMQSRSAGDVLDLGGGMRLRFVDAVLRDMVNTVWLYEESQQALFVADGFAYLHRPDFAPEASDESQLDIDQHVPGQCGLVSNVGDAFPSLEDILFYCSLAFYWSRFRNDSDRNFDQLSELLRTHPTKILAPSHGNVTLDLDRVVPIARQAHREAYQGGRKVES